MEYKSCTQTILGCPPLLKTPIKLKRNTRNPKPVFDSPDTPVEQRSSPRSPQMVPSPFVPSKQPALPVKKTPIPVDIQAKITSKAAKKTTPPPPSTSREAPLFTLDPHPKGSFFRAPPPPSPPMPQPSSNRARSSSQELMEAMRDNPTKLAEWAIHFHSTVGGRKTAQAIRTQWKVDLSSLIRDSSQPGVWRIYVMDDIARNRIVKGGFHSEELTVLPDSGEVHKYSFRTSLWYLDLHIFAKALRKKGVAVLRVYRGKIDDTVLDGSLRILAASLHKDRSITFLIQGEEICLRNQKALDHQRKMSRYHHSKKPATT
eukprot:TRINITY_DN7616_c0_g1_i1.p1 TRINITY_DN7616_c0_g1~~TRINITY_DN7616_c0_g1_i1.p1  ORF type:complete len:316 (+),score=39.29 TRINITY_DN7616_c0_g1_i1:145-1092(+)